ncbi:MAG: AzlC family ABC transporter permease [Oscillospiraceae bacterium]|nr:AzlC family ABC transporter permease [Oscillospiraceae bacterium]
MKDVLKRAVLATLPVMTGYLVLGFGFGMLMRSAGFGVGLSVAMSLFIYAGSMQYAAVGLMTGGASLLTVALTTLMVNARHLFYGVSMLERYRGTGLRKPYLIFSLTDETYSLLCAGKDQGKDFRLLVSVLDHGYWVLGTLLGAVTGALLPIPTQGIEFALTALFLTVFLEQWLAGEDHGPALIGVGVSVACLAVFGSDRFLIPAMVIIGGLLCFYQEDRRDG